jgi:hypothetical protein
MKPEDEAKAIAIYRDYKGSSEEDILKAIYTFETAISDVENLDEELNIETLKLAKELLEEELFWRHATPERMKRLSTRTLSQFPVTLGVWTYRIVNDISTLPNLPTLKVYSEKVCYIYPCNEPFANYYAIPARPATTDYPIGEYNDTDSSLIRKSVDLNNEETKNLIDALGELQMPPPQPCKLVPPNKQRRGAWIPLEALTYEDVPKPGDVLRYKEGEKYLYGKIFGYGDREMHLEHCSDSFETTYDNEVIKNQTIPVKVGIEFWKEVK